MNSIVGNANRRRARFQHVGDHERVTAGDMTLFRPENLDPHLNELGWSAEVRGNIAEG